MFITHELRNYADKLSEHAGRGVTFPNPCSKNSGAPIGATLETIELYDIAERIDKVYERAIIDALNSNWPKDANGEPIHIGDELDGYGYPNGGAYCKAIVNEVTILAGPKDSVYRSWLMWDAKAVRHHHEPTVEDVLREFAIACEDTGNAGPEVTELVAEYAQKLQLKESE